PERAIGIRPGVEKGFWPDARQPGKLAMRRLRHQPDMEIVADAMPVGFRVGMRGQRQLLAGRKPVADDGVFVPGVIVLVGGARGGDGEREDGGEQDAEGFHGCWSSWSGERFELARPSLRGALATKQSIFPRRHGLLRFARNDTS